MFLYSATIFLSAFLLFQVQPIIAKMILPWFGGSAGVWTTCLLFFQIVLLLGYLYAHATIRWLRPKTLGTLHLFLLVASAVLLPIVPDDSWKPAGSGDPIVEILLLLLVSIGLPYFLLSTTGPLLQAWYAQAGNSFGASIPFPYRLYALSNFGSMLALVAYPVAVEPLLTTRWQGNLWSLGYLAFAILCAIVAYGSCRRGAYPIALEPKGNEAGPGWPMLLYWVGLSACSTALLLAVTNHLTQNVAAIPFLWVLPLAVYLLTFILCFSTQGWKWRAPTLAFPALAIAGMVYAVCQEFENLAFSILIPILTGGFFICAMLCHGELARSKPDPRHLTVFYLMISLGGAIGGLFVAVVAPFLFSSYFEMPIAVALCSLIALFTVYRERKDPWWEPSWLTLAGLNLALLVYMGFKIDENEGAYYLTQRNFYGVLRVSVSKDPEAVNAIRTLTHGTIVHGSQFLAEERRTWPTTYYGENSGVGLAIREAQTKGPAHVGIVGLGTGTIATFGQDGDVFRYYEINPEVVDIAKSSFSFLSDSKAETHIVLGDARLSMERETSKDLDVLAVDAFSSDAIPVHLLTKEAFQLYFERLKDSGILLVHVSNRYLDLAPVVKRIADALGLQARQVMSMADNQKNLHSADWILVAKNPDYFSSPLLNEAAKLIESNLKLAIWTDDYSNLYQILRW